MTANKGFLFRLDFNGFLSNLQVKSLNLTHKQSLNLKTPTTSSTSKVPVDKNEKNIHTSITPHKLIVMETD